MARWTKDTDGLFRRGGVYYCTVRGKRISTRCRSRKAAVAVRDQLERAAHDPVYRASLGATVGELAAVTLAEVTRRGRSAETLDYYRSKLGHLVRLFGVDAPLAELSAAGVDDYIDTRRKEQASQHTISKELGALRHLLRVAKRRGAFGGDIDALFPVGFDVGYQPRRRSMSMDEVSLLLRELAPHRQAWVAFAVATGARKSEIERAELGDISESWEVVQIRGRKTELADDAIAVPAAFRGLLLIAANQGSPTGPLVGVWGNATRDLKEACQRAGIARVTPNDLRRTHATLLRASGTSIDLVARQLRHADSRMAQQVYGRLTAEQVAGLLPGQAARQLHSQAAPIETDGVSDGDRTRDNRSHRPLSDSVDTTFPEGIARRGDARDAEDRLALHACCTPAVWSLALAFERVSRRVA